MATETRDPVVEALNTVAKKLDSLWALIFFGLVAPAWVGAIVWFVLTNRG